MDITGILYYLETILQDEGCETLITENDDFPVLRTQLENLGDIDGRAIMEIVAASTVINGRERILLQTYTTFAADIAENTVPSAIAGYNELNLTCPYGLYGVYTKLRQGYHKFTDLLPENENEAYSRAAETVNLVRGLIDANFAALILIADGKR